MREVRLHTGRHALRTFHKLSLSVCKCSLLLVIQCTLFVLCMPETELLISYNSCFTCLQTNCVKALVSCNSCWSFHETRLFKAPLLLPPQS